MSTIIFWGCILILLYTVIGYPLVIWLFSFISETSTGKEDIFPTVALVIAAYNEEDVIEKKIKNSLAIEYPADKFSIIIASDGSHDKTDEIVLKFKNSGVKLFNPKKRNGKINVLKSALKTIDSEIVLFSDANVFYSSDAVTELVKNFADPQVGAASGIIALINDDIADDHSKYTNMEDIYFSYETFIRRAETAFYSTVGVDGAMYAIRSHLFKPPPYDTILDDMWIPFDVISQGYRVVMEPKARGIENTPANIDDDLKRRIRILAGGIQLLKGSRSFKLPLKFLFQYASHKILRWFSSCLLLLIFISVIFLLEEHFFYKLVFAGYIMVVSVMICGSLLGNFIKNMKYISFVYQVGFINYVSLIGIYKGVLDKQSVRWDRPKRQ